MNAGSIFRSSKRWRLVYTTRHEVTKLRWNFAGRLLSDTIGRGGTLIYPIFFRLRAPQYGDRGFHVQCSKSARRSSLSYPITPIHRYAMALAQQSALLRVMQELAMASTGVLHCSYTRGAVLKWGWGTRTLNFPHLLSRYKLILFFDGWFPWNSYRIYRTSLSILSGFEVAGNRVPLEIYRYCESHRIIRTPQLYHL